MLLVCPFAKLVEEELKNPGSMRMKDVHVRTLAMSLQAMPARFKPGPARLINNIYSLVAVQLKYGKP